MKKYSKFIIFALLSILPPTVEHPENELISPPFNHPPDSGVFCQIMRSPLRFHFHLNNIQFIMFSTKFTILL